MPFPGNGIFVVQGEMSILLTAMRRGTRWSSHSHQDEENILLIRSFSDLKDVLNDIGDLQEIDPNHFLGPFLEVIRSEETNGPVTSLALSSVNKFISYGLIDPDKKSVPMTVENIADTVTHARFVGTDQASDGVVLMKILQVLRTLMLSPIGTMLTNESVCEIMLSCFRICFETRLSELLRRCAEHCLKDMVQLLFTRLPQFSEESVKFNNIKTLKMHTAAAVDTPRVKRKSRLMNRTQSFRSNIKQQEEIYPLPHVQSQAVTDDATETPASRDSSDKATPLATTPMAATGNIVDMQGTIHQETTELAEATVDPTLNPDTSESTPYEVAPDMSTPTDNIPQDKQEALNELPESSPVPEPSVGGEPAEEWVNQQGVRFLPADTQDNGESPLVAHGMLCVRELLRFLISLCNPQDKQNTEVMVHTGLTLLTVALEVGCDTVGFYVCLLALIKDDLCRNLFALMYTDRLSIFAADLQVMFLVFESQRTHLKFQLELYLARLTDIIFSDSTSKVTYEQREIALEAVVQLWRIPGLVTELYLNYDCDLYSENLYEELTKLLSKNAFPVTGVYSTHLLSLDALLTIVDSIESHCHSRILEERQQGGQEVPPAVMPSAKDIARKSRCPAISKNIPSHEQLMAIKRKKKLLASGTEHFNSKPKKGIQFLQEHHLLSTPLDPHEVVSFLRVNPHLDKKMIGEYISSRSNLAVLDCFVKLFDFTETRIDEALRLYLETFRLPGESPLISLIMEHFAEHWHKCNGEPFVNADAAFTLAYAVIMLNVDQHNHNVKRQKNPMTVEEFKRNLKKVNGGHDFDQEMLDEIYIAIKTEEIVMPAEQTGLVRENYLWKVLLRRGASCDGQYMHAPIGLLDHDLFALIWGPTITALSCLYDKSSEPPVYQKAITGFRKCAMISAHYGMSNNFDNLIASLCKFTLLHCSNESPENLAILFGSSAKARLAAKTVFHLTHRHGDIMQEGWANILDCILQLYRCKLLPKILVEAEDFIELSGKISLMREEMPIHQKSETGLLSSLYSYIALASEPVNMKAISLEDQDYMRLAQNCIRESHLEKLVTESKFLRLDSLQHLTKALMKASYGPQGYASGTVQNEDVAVFFLELLLKMIIQNRDRVCSVWGSVQEHIYTLMMAAAATDQHFLLERGIVGLLRLAIRLMRREEMSPVVLQSLRMLLLLKSSTLNRVSRQIAYGLFDLLKTSAANIHSTPDWAVIFTLLECVGAGAPPPRVIGQPVPFIDSGARSDSEVRHIEESGLENKRAYTSDSELFRPQSLPEISRLAGGGWIVVGDGGEIQAVEGRTQFNVSYELELSGHNPFSLVKCCESLAFLVRDVAHITPYNFENCVHCIRTFVEASLETHEKRHGKKKSAPKENTTKPRRKWTKKKEDTGSNRTSPTNPYDADESDSDELPSGYHQISIQLLDLMHTLHTRTAQIYKWWGEENPELELGSLWAHGWCPLLQGISRLCCDARRQVRMSGITYLQRALLVHDLQTLNGEEWESCFSKVLFPLLTKLLEPISCQPNDSEARSSLEETRIRAATLLSKVFLHHLTPLQTLPTFSNLWLTILDFLHQYINVDNSELLSEAIPELLKNMLLVMDSAKVFSDSDDYSPLWTLTWDRIDSFLPRLKQELFKESSVVDSMGIEEPVNELCSESEPVETTSSDNEFNQRSDDTTTGDISSIFHPPQPIVTVNQQLVGSWPLPSAISPLMGQLVSSPIGPPPPESPPTQCTLPVYSGFATKDAPEFILQ